MSVIVWDGKQLAADRLAVNGNLKRTMTKVWRKGDILIGGAGTASSIQAIMGWFENGAKAEDFPKLTEGEGAAVWVVNRNGHMAKWEDSPYPLTYHEEKWAEGSGRDFALGAMEMGADAIRAVEVASKYDAYCGHGHDAVSFDD